MKKIYLFLLPLVITAVAGCSNYGSKEITILYTNDVHGSLGSDLSYASIAKMKNDLKRQGKKVLLFDSGDHTSGGLYCSYLQGLPIVNIMNNAGYDAAIFGNHEFDHSFTGVEAFENFATYPYIATNLYHCEPDGPVTNPYTNTSYVFDLGNIKVGAIGVSTPYSMVTSTPSYFKDKDGHQIYSFLDGNEGNDLYQAVQKEINILRNEKQCTYVICLAHMGGDHGSTDLFTSENLVKNTEGIDAVLDGHTHEIVPGTIVKNKAGKDILITQTGSHFKNIGKLTINSQGKITNDLISSHDGKDQVVAKLESNVIDQIDKEFGVEIATADFDFVAHDSDANWKVRRQETNLGDLCADAFYYTLNNVLAKEDKNAVCDVSIINSGAVRNDVAKKTWQLLDCRNVHTFDNNVAVKQMTGNILKIYLEFATRKFKGTEDPSTELGALPQVQGIAFKINPTVTSNIVLDENGNYKSGGPTPGRIVDVQIFDKNQKQYVPINDDTLYLVGGSAYVLEDGGDGCTMFKDTKSMYRTSSYVDYQVLAEYIKSFKTDKNGLPIISTETSQLYTGESGLKINYENHDGSGRFGKAA